MGDKIILPILAVGATFELYLSPDAVEAGIEEELLDLVKEKVSYHQMLTAGNYLGDTGFWGWIAWGVDLFNPGADISETISFVQDIESIIVTIDKEILEAMGLNYEDVMEMRRFMASMKLQQDRWPKQPTGIQTTTVEF